MPSSPQRVLLGAALLSGITACGHGAGRRTGTPTAFLDGAPTGVAEAEADRLAKLAKGDADARAVRLDRLIDLFDAARFAGDASARDTLWLALGGHGSGRGPEATRDALSRLLAEAMALSEQRFADASTRDLVNDMVAMLSTDLSTPGSADDLAVRTLSYRTLAKEGHARIRDNAHWRLYDHVRGTLSAAIAAPPDRRIEVAVQARYAERESVAKELADAGVHEQPRWTGPRTLVDLLGHERDALAHAQPWSKVVQERAQLDDELGRTVLATLPAERPGDLGNLLRPRGTGRRESLGPIAKVGGGRMEIDLGRPQARTMPLDGEDVTEVAETLRAALAQDGRGVVLLAAAPDVPAPELRRALRALRRAQTGRVELAIAEPHAGGGNVVTALPLEVVRDDDPGAGSQAMMASRIHAHIGGRGVELALDGKWLAQIPEGSDALVRRVDALVKAYPRERTVRVTIGADASFEQIVDALVALEGGEQPRFAAIGWAPDETRPSGNGDPKVDELLAGRLAWADLRKVDIEQPFTLAGEDQARLRSFADAVPKCLPELQVPAKLAPRPAAQRVEVKVTLSEGRVSAIEPAPIAGIKPKQMDGLRACLKDEGYGLRLREHRDTIAVTLKISAKP
ncbi:MAG TPA: hypothetical protein VG755_27485 [Nannocystaceae bacterium]|nr:hypothetical protein [Nannocystaceae bacterium]